MRPTSLPLHPWQKISADLFQAKQQHFLVVMNYYSRYLEIAYLPDISSATMIGKMKNMFARWCAPEEIVFDNGTQFTSAAFQSFAEKYNFVCSFTSPHFPQANGQAESAVKIAKRIVEQQQDPFLGLMAYRSTPISATDVSPAQLMMERPEGFILMLMSTPALAFFGPAKLTIVSADASSYGIGASLFQDHEGQLKPVAFCYRTLTSGEVKYAQIEKECLASVWACEHFSRYLIGLETFTLLTDHKPLVPLINTQDLDKVPVRCQRLLMRLRRFSAKAEYVPGKHLIVPDTLSRSPLKINEVSTIEKCVELFAIQIESTRSVSDAKIQKIKEESLKDRYLQAAMSYTKNGWPTHRNAVTEPVKGYFDARSELSVSNDLLLYRDGIVIPVSLRSEIIGTIHEGHQGASKCLDRVKMTVWWPGISRLIKENVLACEFCQIHRSSHHKEQ